jgi:hypothetical protein
VRVYLVVVDGSHACGLHVGCEDGVVQVRHVEQMRGGLGLVVVMMGMMVGMVMRMMRMRMRMRTMVVVMMMMMVVVLAPHRSCWVSQKPTVYLISDM